MCWDSEVHNDEDNCHLLRNSRGFDGNTLGMLKDSKHQKGCAHSVLESELGYFLFLVVFCIFIEVVK